MYTRQPPPIVQGQPSSLISAGSRRRFLHRAAVLGLVTVCGALGPACRPSSSSTENGPRESGRVYRLGILQPGQPDGPSLGPFPQLVDALDRLGYRLNENLAIEYREGTPLTFERQAAELVQLPVDAIVAYGERAVRAAMQATTTIPVIMAAANDPVETGLVASLAKPGGNVTGRAGLLTMLAAKRLDLLRRAVPGATRIAVLCDSGVVEANRTLRALKDSANALGLPLQPVELPTGPGGPMTEGRLVEAFGAMAREQADAALVVSTASVAPWQQLITKQATAHRLPVMYDGARWVRQGGLMSYSPSLDEEHQQTASYIARVFAGARPADLPVEQPAKFDFVINLPAARTLDLVIPADVLVQATEVIE